MKKALLDYSFKGITLMETVIAMGVIAVLAAIVLTAIQPHKNIGSAYAVQRERNRQTIADAIDQFYVQNGELPDIIPVSVEEAMAICRTGYARRFDEISVVPTGLPEYPFCANLDVLTVKSMNLLVAMPYDETYPNNDILTGFTVHRDEQGKPVVTAVESTDPTGLPSGEEDPEELPQPTVTPPCTSGGSPFVLCSCDDLANIPLTGLTNSYVLGADIDCSAVEDFQPIGDQYTNPFSGSFDGQYHLISNVNITASDSAYEGVGLFGMTNEASIKNLVLDNINIYAANTEGVGGLVGLALETDIDRVALLSGNVVSYNTAGGLVGYMDSYLGGISNSYVSATVTAAYNAGHMVGQSNQGFSCSPPVGPRGGIDVETNLVGGGATRIFTEECDEWSCRSECYNGTHYLCGDEYPNPTPVCAIE